MSIKERLSMGSEIGVTPQGIIVYRENYNQGWYHEKKERIYVLK
jgi:hypothetical protein